jgi:hypothetical protein
MTTLRTINLKEGMPTLEQARARLAAELKRARGAGEFGLKLIHGYGSTGVGGTLRTGLGATLMRLQREGELKHVIFGEHWRMSDAAAWAVVLRHPALKQDCDWGRGNRGVTIVIL